MNIIDLPDDMLNLIIENLDRYSDIARFSQVSKLFQELICNQKWWNKTKDLYRQLSLKWKFTFGDDKSIVFKTKNKWYDFLNHYDKIACDSVSDTIVLHSTDPKEKYIYCSVVDRKNITTYYESGIIVESLRQGNVPFIITISYRCTTFDDTTYTIIIKPYFET